ncbi:ABC transporter ATP-binding protein [Paenarthrobacter nitroguajacolicus]|uniref:ABC transporter ATP-binding protein n=1 Tax=Paenarthrobacter nitroguajacolicus TaxID=211146 RepID=UPI00248C1C71|nr:ABC transporter ATP-binding protein [Paenarthrobacter nitroguajacolicus]MDI2036254.1 Oligosaccharides import ATP-binding protein MsmX [Paenarthrobacter nitroguajacolicus]
MSQSTTHSSITINELRKSYSKPKHGEQAYAVDGISFEVPKGQFVTLLGPSGCGKTTTLRCIAGLEQPDEGQIIMAGQTVFDGANKTQIRPEDRPIAMVPQSYGIWPHMTVLDNAAFPLRHGRHRKGQQNIKQRTLDMLDQVGLAPYADRWSTQLSGGQQQRLALARALLSEPEVLLLDEPLSNLDAKLRAKLRLELRAFQEQFGVTSVYVTHDQAEALALSDLVVVMNQGRIEQIDRPERLYQQPKSAFVADFIGSANLIPVHQTSTVSDGLVAQTDIGTFLCAGEGQATGASGQGGNVCIRPENVEVSATTVSRHNGAQHNEMQGRVIGAEFLGDRLELVIDVEGTKLTASTPAVLAVRPGDDVSIRVSPVNARYLAS